jgi:hypothetical protein
MIVIWDNGGEYSDHKICFIDAGVSAKEFVRLLSIVKFRRGDRARVLAVAEAIDWRDPSAVMTPASFYDDVVDQIDHDESCPQYDWDDGDCTCWAKDLCALCEEAQR